MRVVLVGGAGLVGRALQRTLGAAPHGHAVVVVDRTTTAPAETDNVALDICSASDAAWAAALDGADAVVHLAAQVNPPSKTGRAAMRELHTRGTERVFGAAVKAGVKHAVLVSSAVVYGARRGAYAQWTETMPATPNADFPYAVDKAAQEDIARRYRDALTLCVVRPAIIYGRGARSFLTEIIKRAPGVLPAINGRRPLQDFVHVDDVAGAIAHLVSQRAAGVFNIPSAAPMSLDEVAAVARLRIVPTPKRLVAPFLNAGARFVPAHLRAPAYILDYLTYPFVMSGEKLIAAGYTPKITSRAALEEMLGRP